MGPRDNLILIGDFNMVESRENTWQGKGTIIRVSKREARLDTIYASKAFLDKMIKCESKVYNRCLDHKPFEVNMNFCLGKKKDTWFKAEPRLFGFKTVKESI